MSAKRKKRQIEYGDFQTPKDFARKVCAFLATQGIRPESILEPTCGQGAFLLAALDQFSQVKKAVGLEINSAYVNYLRQQIAQREDNHKTKIIHDDFFASDWTTITAELPDPLLIIGNPPWVNNAALGVLDSDNLPPKKNGRNYAGIEAITGASNFDISEWILLKTISWLNERQGVVAMLCKTSVARKALAHVWADSHKPGFAQIHLFDAESLFGVSVDACLLIYKTTENAPAKSCKIYNDISADSLVAEIGYRDGQLIANVPFYERWRRLANQGKTGYQWRSGIKHDCAKVMELEKVAGGYRNKLGKFWELEDEYLYPALKSSDIAGPIIRPPSRWMLVTQKK